MINTRITSLDITSSLTWSAQQQGFHLWAGRLNLNLRGHWVWQQTRQAALPFFVSYTLLYDDPWLTVSCLFVSCWVHCSADSFSLLKLEQKALLWIVRTKTLVLHFFQISVPHSWNSNLPVATNGSMEDFVWLWKDVITSMNTFVKKVRFISGP